MDISTQEACAIACTEAVKAVIEKYRLSPEAFDVALVAYRDSMKKSAQEMGLDPAKIK